MADEQYELRRINWTELFAFTHLFKSFKMAIQPSKMLLALAAVTIIFVLGAAMDGVWSLADENVYPGEIHDHFAKASWDFEKDKESRLDKRVAAAADLAVDSHSQKYRLNDYRFSLPVGALKEAFGEAVRQDNEGQTYNSLSAETLRKDKELGELLSSAREFFDAEVGRIEELLEKAAKKAEGDQGAEEDADKRDEAEAELAEHQALAQRKITERKVRFAQRIEAIEGGGVFESLLDYESRCLANGIAAVRYGNIFGGLRQYRATMAAKGVTPLAVRPAQPSKIDSPAPVDERAGLICWTLMGLHGLGWLVSQHWLYALIFLTASMAVVAFFGGAIHRIAALHFARDEKLSFGRMTLPHELARVVLTEQIYRALTIIRNMPYHHGG